MSGPILIPCEGSGGDGAAVYVFGPRHMCRMCGAMFERSPIPAHERDDVLARIDRGDFG